MNPSLKVFSLVLIVAFALTACGADLNAPLGSPAGSPSNPPAPNANPTDSSSSGTGSPSGSSLASCKGLSGDSFSGNGWADDAYLPNPNPLKFGVAFRPWQTSNGQTNLVWLLLYMDPKASGDLTVTIPDAYVLKGVGNGIFCVSIALDNRALEQLHDRGETGKDPYDTACNGDTSGLCKKNGNRMSMYLDQGKYAVLDADGNWIDMSAAWRQVVLPPKGDNTTYELVINMHDSGNWRLHIGGAETANGGWHSEIKLPLASVCR